MAENLGSVYTEFRLRLDGLENDMRDATRALEDAYRDMETTVTDSTSDMADETRQLMDQMQRDWQEFGREVTASVNDGRNAIRATERDIRDMAASSGESITEMRNDWNYMNNDMRRAYRDAARAMAPFKRQQQEVEYGFFQLSQSMSDYQGTTEEFLAELSALGDEHKRITDEMLKNDQMSKAGFLESIATLQSRSSQAEKIMKNFQRMDDPLYTVNEGLLGIADSMNEIAKQGDPAYLALSMLGPTANMKELQDMTNMINQGLMRFQSVAMVALGANALLFGSLHSAASDAIPEYKKAMDDMMQSLGKMFQPMVEVFATIMIQVAKVVTKIADLVVAFNEAHPTAAKLIQGFIMLVTVLTLILSPLAIGIGAINGMIAAFSSLWLLIGPIVTGFAAMMGTVVLVAGALIAAGVAIYYAWKTNFGGFKDFVIDTWNLVVAKFNEAKAIIMPIIMDTVNYIKQQWKTVQPVLQPLITFLETVFGVAFKLVYETIKFYLDAVIGVIKGVVTVITGIIKLFVAIFTGDWKTAWEAVKQIVVGAVTAIWNLFKLWFVGKIASMLGGFLSGVLGAFKGWATSAGSAISGFAKTAFNAIKNFVTGGINAFKNFVTNSSSKIVSFVGKAISSFASFVSTALGKIASFVTGAIGKFASFAASALGKIAGFVSGAITKIGYFAAGALNKIKSFVSGAIGAIRNFASSILSSVKNAMSGFMSAIASGVSTALSKLRSFASSIPQAFGSVVSSMGSIGKNIVSGIWNGVQNMGGWLKNNLMSWAKSVIPNAVQKALGIHSPSRVLADKVGQYLPSGIAMGAEDNVRDLQDMATTLSAAATKALQDKMAQNNIAASISTSVPIDNSTRAVQGTGVTQMYSFNGPLVGQAAIRSDQDVKDISQKLYDRISQKNRTQGAVVL